MTMFYNKEPIMDELERFDSLVSHLELLRVEGAASARWAVDEIRKLKEQVKGHCDRKKS